MCVLYIITLITKDFFLFLQIWFTAFSKHVKKNRLKLINSNFFLKFKVVAVFFHFTVIRCVSVVNRCKSHFLYKKKKNKTIENP